MGNITLYHNTSNQNAVKINTEGIKGGMRLSVYGKGSEAEGAGIWCSTVRGYGYGGATITFEIDENDENLVEQNDTEYIVYRNIKPEEIIDIDLMVSSISSVQGHTSTVESDIPSIINKFGKDKLLDVFKKNEGKFVSPYNYDTLINLIETENKYCKGKIQILESKRITEGIHLYGYVTDEDGNSKVIEDSDYPDKKSFENDLRCNGYKVRKIKDNRDMYLVDNSDFVSVDAVKKRIKELQKDIDNGFSALGQKNEIAKLKELLDNANKISLTESRKLKESIGNEWVQAQYDNLERLQDRLKQTLKIDSRLEYAKTGKPKLEFEYADRQFRTIFIRSAISKNRNGTFYLLYPDNKKFENADSFERYIDEIGIVYRNSKKKVESKKLEEASRNELLAKSKAETITRYNKSAGYKGFSLVDIDTTSIKTRDAIVITNRVGDYFDTIELDDILYWVGLEVDEARDKKMSLETVRKALLGAMDGMNIKVDCNCGDFCLEENTLIKLLNGNVVTVKQLKDMFDNKDELWLYSTDSNGDFRPGKVENVWVSGKSDKMVKVTLDNGREIITTPNHKYMMRDGSYKEAQYLSEYDSLMPLYFSYHNGYENVKLNSKKATQFHSVYKIVADTLLSKEKELAKERSGEDTIQIHHKDFNKLNNYPSNLEPKGKLEHWYYHASLAGKNIDKLIKAGRDFWESDPRRFEALEKQKEMASKCKKEWWASMTKDERHRWALENNWACQPENLKSISDNAKDIWRKYTENEKNHRLRTNPFIVNNPMKDEVFKNSDKFIQRNKDISNSLQRFHENTTQEQRSELYGWAKGKKFSDSHRSKISKALKKKSNETQRKGIITRCRKTINRIIENNLPINEENFEIYKGKYDPSYLRVFDNFNDMLNKLDIPTNYNHKVIGVELITYDNSIEVYDIEVKDYHNFYVDAGVMLHNCYRFAYMASVLEYKYGKPENRPSNITNPNGYGAMCKHLISLLSNKSWVKQVASTLQQWIVDEIDWVRDFLKVSEEDFQLPDEYARQLGKHGAMKKFWDKTPDVDEADSEEDIDGSNEDAPETEENNEETNDTPDTNNLNNQSNMPKAFRDNNSNEELEEK